MSSDWSKKTPEDILGDINSAAETLRKKSGVPAIITPDNWGGYRKAGYMPDHINSYDDFKKWYTNLTEEAPCK